MTRQRTEEDEVRAHFAMSYFLAPALFGASAILWSQLAAARLFPVLEILYWLVVTALGASAAFAICNLPLLPLYWRAGQKVLPPPHSR